MVYTFESIAERRIKSIFNKILINPKYENCGYSVSHTVCGIRVSCSIHDFYSPLFILYCGEVIYSDSIDVVVKDFIKSVPDSVKRGFDARAESMNLKLNLKAGSKTKKGVRL